MPEIRWALYIIGMPILWYYVQPTFATASTLPLLTAALLFSSFPVMVGFLMIEDWIQERTSGILHEQ